MFLQVRCVAHLTFFKRYALMPVVKNRVSSEASGQTAQAAVDHRLPPIIGLASRPVLRPARSFEYWNLVVPPSLEFEVWEFGISFPRPKTPDPKFKV